MSKKGGVTGVAMKAVGRNVARADNQKGSGAVTKKFAKGGPVSGQARGCGAAVKGKGFQGVY